MTWHYRKRRDANHDEVFRAVSKVTWAKDIHHAAGGLGDILAQHVITKQPVFLEVKAKQSDKLTDTEKAFAAVFGPFRAWACVHSVDEALRAVGLNVEGGSA